MGKSWHDAPPIYNMFQYLATGGQMTSNAPGNNAAPVGMPTAHGRARRGPSVAAEERLDCYAGQLGIDARGPNDKAHGAATTADQARTYPAPIIGDGVDAGQQRATPGEQPRTRSSRRYRDRVTGRLPHRHGTVTPADSPVHPSHQFGA
jgi:hypothetical protein